MPRKATPITLNPVDQSKLTRDYKRNGTATLFAALEVAVEKAAGQCYARRRHQEFLKSLKCVDAEFPGEITPRLVMDNYGTHTHPQVQAWLKRHNVALLV